MASPGAGAAPSLTAEQIIARHVQASGGAQAWREIETMAWTGRIESGRVGNFGVPFLLMFKRPNSTHFEIMAQNQKSLRLFDGTAGWKLRPTGQGRPEWQGYTADEIRFARDAAGLDGPLFDYKEKGVSVSLRGTGTVEGHEAYRLELKLPSGETRTDWIDVKSFLDLKYDRIVHDETGRTGVVSVYYRNHQKIQGLVLPLTIETGDVAGKLTDKMMIDKIALNPTLPDNAFSKPMAPQHRGGVVIDTAKAAAAQSPERQ
jgi:outer membrane lipoprotein-sorting protein